MTAFTALERAVLHSIFSETPNLISALESQMEAAAVAERYNSGAGFFTYIIVPDHVPTVESPRVLGRETHARVMGLQHELGFILFMENGRLDTLEAFVLGDENTVSLDLDSLSFEVRRVANQGDPPNPVP